MLLERQTAKTTFKNAEERVCRVYVCGGTVCFSAFFFSEKKKCFTSEKLDGLVAKLSPDRTLCFQH